MISSDGALYAPSFLLRAPLERGGRQSIFKKQIAIIQIRTRRVIRPGIPHPHGMRHLLAPDNDDLSLDTGFRRYKMPILTRDGEPFQLASAFNDKPGIHFIEINMDAVAMHLHRMIHGSRS